MERRGILVFVFMILLIGRGSGSPLTEILRVLASAGEGNRKVKEPPSPSPVPLVKGDKDVAPSNADPPKPDPNSKDPPVNHKDPPSGDGEKKGGSPEDNKKHGGDGGAGGGKKVDDAPATPGNSLADGECGTQNSCTDVGKRLLACLRPGEGPGKLHLIVKNEGDDALTVTIKSPASVQVVSKKLNLPKHQYEKVNISVTAPDSVVIVLEGGHGECILHTIPAEPTWNFLQNLPSYATHLTPIYGAYILFLTLLIVGGLWACCKFGRGTPRGESGIPYQELEMGYAQTSSAVEEGTADGWDQGWDDDWVENTNVKTSEIRPVGSISGNGLSSRSANKEGWDDDWDD